MAEGETRPPVPDGGKTMQLDAIVDDLEEVAAAPDLGRGPTRPPPLPPRKTSKAMVIAGVVIVLLAAGLGIGAGAWLLGEPGDASGAVLTDGPNVDVEPVNVERVDVERAAPAEQPAAPTEEETEGAAGSPDVVQLDDVVVGAE